MTHPIAISIYLLNLCAFVVYGVDKWRARRGKSRISERTLLLLALPFASPGALLAMRLFRHKTRKPSFQYRLAVIVVLHAVALGYWLGTRGGAS